MKLLITGANGQLGKELVRRGGEHDVLAVDHGGLDICDADAVNAVCGAFNPDVIINAAAYTAVDQAESEVALAYAVNRDGAKNLAVAAELASIPLIHISTDYVFDGSKKKAYLESDPVNPLGVYGLSKQAGEEAVQTYCSKHIILRTSWVFSAYGNNFVKTMLRLGSERDTLGIVSDQHGCPTSANELARAIFAVIETGLSGKWGVYHFCQPIPTTWFEFANAIFSEFKKQGRTLKVAHLNAISTSAYPTPAKRPVNSVMDCSKFEKVFGFTIRPWRDSFAEVIREM